MRPPQESTDTEETNDQGRRADADQAESDARQVFHAHHVEHDREEGADQENGTGQWNPDHHPRFQRVQRRRAGINTVRQGKVAEQQDHHAEDFDRQIFDAFKVCFHL